MGLFRTERGGDADTPPPPSLFIEQGNGGGL